MLKTFKAILKDNNLQWLDETPEITSNSFVKVHVTLLEEPTIIETRSDGKKMAEALDKLSKNNAFAGVDPQEWQREIRQDRTLPNRD
ncbi:MAG: hypothetical protein F6K47_40940 [Symploca sp. SIO2E6]|nr:hypothetical protein [Symploca sp. SIO2E6]